MSAHQENGENRSQGQRGKEIKIEWVLQFFNPQASRQEIHQKERHLGHHQGSTQNQSHQQIPIALLLLLALVNQEVLPDRKQKKADDEKNSDELAQQPAWLLQRHELLQEHPLSGPHLISFSNQSLALLDPYQNRIHLLYHQLFLFQARVLVVAHIGNNPTVQESNDPLFLLATDRGQLILVLSKEVAGLAQVSKSHPVVERFILFRK